MSTMDGISFLAKGFEWLLRSSWQGAVLIVAVLLVQAALRGRLSARWRFNLWFLVMVRLLLPFSPESALSVFNFVKPQPVVRLVQSAPEALSPCISAAPVPGRISAATDTQPAGTDAKKSSADTSVASFHPEQNQLGRTSVVQPIRSLSALEIAALIWLAGALGLWLHVAWLAFRTRRQIDKAIPIQDPAVVSLFNECRGQMGVCASLRLMETAIVKSPALCGLFRSSLLLPPGLTRAFSPRELRYIFLHELAHFKRRDVALNWLITVLQIAHWFNPFVWHGFARLRADRELACDALAMGTAREEEAKDYGRTIIKLLETLSRPSVLPGLVGIMEDKRQMVRRIRMIAAFKKTRRWSIPALVILAVLAVTGLTDAVKSKDAKAASAKPDETFPVTLLDARTGKPLANASVICASPWLDRIAQGEPRKVRTDAKGIVNGQWDSNGAFPNIHVMHPDYAPVVVQWPWPNFDPAKKPQKPREYSVKLQPGVEIGGIVRDEDGKPVSGVRVEIEGMSNSWRGNNEDLSPYEYPFFKSLWGRSPVTDANGKWSCAHFPGDIGLVQFSLVRPDNACRQFHTETQEWHPDALGDEIPIAALRAKNAVFVLKKGIAVRGVVLDSKGNPLPNVTVTETDGRAHAKPVYEFKTDANGRFELPDRDPHQILLVAKVPGLALKTEVVDIAPGMPELRLQMAAPSPARVRVVDQNDKPVPKATIALAGFTFRMQPAWSGTTGADGRLGWKDAPGEAFKYTVTAEGYDSATVDRAPGEKEQTVRLTQSDGPSFPVSLKVETVDRQPVDAFKVSVVIRGRTADEDGEEFAIGQGKNGRFEGKIPEEKRQYQGYFLKIEAADREPCTISPEHADSKDPVVLRQASPIQGVVLTPNGKPAAKAIFVFNTADVLPTINLRLTPAPQPETSYRDQHKVQADAEGRYSLTSHSGDGPVVVFNDDGFTETTLVKLARSPEVHLLPWGRFEGVITVNAKPKPDAKIVFQSSCRSNYYLSVWTDIKTDATGRFEFQKFPPGEYPIQYSTPGKSMWPQNHLTNIQVKPGETTRLAYEITGRTLTGRIQAPPWFEVDWNRDPISQMLTLKRRRGTDTHPEYGDYVRADDFMKAQDEWLASVRKSPQHPETYQLEFDTDGSFRVEGIAPGAYELDLKLGKKANYPAQDKVTASLKCEIVVPPAREGQPTEPFNVGPLKMEPEGDDSTNKAPLALLAKTLEGKPFSLADYRGKCVLLVFWAPWAGPSTEETAALKSVEESFGSDPRFAVVGLAVEDRPDKIEAYPQANELKWINTRLEGENKAGVTEAWGVNSLPEMFLIGPEGWIVARNINAPHLHAAIEDLLKTTK